MLTINLVTDSAVILDKDRKVLSTNDLFLQQFNLKAEEIIEQSVREIVDNNWKTNKLDSILLQAGPAHLFIQQDFQRTGLKDVFVKTQPVNKVEEGKGLVSLVTFKNQNSG